jgi:hypothetical protein
MLPLDCLFLSLHKTQDEDRQSRKSNTENWRSSRIDNQGATLCTEDLLQFSVMDFLLCLSSSCVLCTQCCPFIVYSWAPSVFCVRFSVLSVFVLCLVKNWQWRGNIGYTRHRTKTDKTENPTQKTEGAQGPLIVYSWAPSVFCVRFSVLSVFVLCLVYTMLSFHCQFLSSFSFLCWIFCCVCLRTKTDKTENLTEKIEGAQELTIKGQHCVHKTQDEDRQNRKSNTENW